MKKAIVILLCAFGFCAALGGVPHCALAQNLGHDIRLTVTHSKLRDPYEPLACSWYGTSASFKNSVSLKAHNYDGSNVGIEMTCSSSRSGSFTVALYRGTKADTKALIGSAQFSRNGFTKATWTNVGSGTYHFVLSGAGGTTITANDIAMYSW